MSARIQQLLRLMAGYSLAAYVGPIFTVILTPLYTRVLRPADYALLDLLTTIGGLCASLATLGLGHALTVHYYDHDELAQNRVTATAALIALVWSILVALPLWPAAPWIATTLLGGLQYADLLLLAAINIPLAALGLVMQTTLRLMMAVMRANILALVNLLLTVALNVLLVLLLRQGVWGIQITAVATGLWLALGGALLVGRERWGWPQPALVGPLLRAGVGALPGVLALWALGFSDRLILPLFGIPAEERGWYAIAAKLASMMAIVIMPFQIAWGPLALSMRGDQAAPQTYARVLSLFAAGAIGLGLALALFAREILLVFTTSDYLGAAAYVAPLTVITVANGLTVCAGVGAALMKRTEVTGIALLIGAGLNLLLNLLLIPRFGVWGAAWATAAGYAIVPTIVYAWSQRIHHIPYRPQHVLLALLAAAALLLVAAAAPAEGWLGVLARIGLLALYPPLLLAAGVIQRSDLRAMAALLRRRAGAGVRNG
jgi:O-antigen/teichoic acid export membrane protein